MYIIYIYPYLFGIFRRCGVWAQELTGSTPTLHSFETWGPLAENRLRWTLPRCRAARGSRTVIQSDSIQMKSIEEARAKERPRDLKSVVDSNRRLRRLGAESCE